MIRSKEIENRLRQGRLAAKTRDSLFRRKIEQGANCAPFVSKAILQTVKEVFPIDPEDEAAQLGLGRLKLLVVAAEPPTANWPDSSPRNAPPRPASAGTLLAVAAGAPSTRFLSE